MTDLSNHGCAWGSYALHSDCERKENNVVLGLLQNHHKTIYIVARKRLKETNSQEPISFIDSLNSIIFLHICSM